MNIGYRLDRRHTPNLPPPRTAHTTHLSRNGRSYRFDPESDSVVHVLRDMKTAAFAISRKRQHATYMHACTHSVQNACTARCPHLVADVASTASTKSLPSPRSPFLAGIGDGARTTLLSSQHNTQAVLRFRGSDCLYERRNKMASYIRTSRFLALSSLSLKFNEPCVYVCVCRPIGYFICTSVCASMYFSPSSAKLEKQNRRANSHRPV